MRASRGYAWSLWWLVKSLCPYPQDTVACAHCGQVIELDNGVWRHRDTGWRICDVSARTMAVTR